MLIDAHKAVSDLTEVGVPQDQAERFVEVVTRADDEVATEEDICLLRADLERTKWQVIVITTSAVAALLAIFEFLV
jgi:hypothetical protein